MIVRYASIPDLCRDAADKGMAIARRGDFAWITPYTLPLALEKAKYGDASLVPRAEALLERVNARVESPSVTWQSSVTGAYPCVPDYLIGLPDSMRARLPDRGENTPINIFICCSLSGGVREDEAIERGVAILALTMALQRYRPVTLEICNIGALVKNHREIEDYVSVTPINCNPLDLATACHALTNRDFTRQIFYSLEAAHSHAVRWPEAYTRDRGHYLTNLYQRLGGSGDDIVINPGFLAEIRGVDMVDWVNAQIDRVTARAEV